MQLQRLPSWKWKESLSLSLFACATPTLPLIVSAWRGKRAGNGKVKCLHLTLSSYENSLSFYSGCSWPASCTFSALLLCNLFDVLPHQLRIRHVVGSVVVCERTQWQTKAEKTLKVTTTGRQEGQQKRRKKWEKEAEERICAVSRPRPCCLVARHNEDNKSKQIKLEAAVLHVEISFLHSRFALFAPFRQNNLLKLFASIRLAVLCLSLSLSLFFIPTTHRVEGYYKFVATENVCKRHGRPYKLYILTQH